MCTGPIIMIVVAFFKTCVNDNNDSAGYTSNNGDNILTNYNKKFFIISILKTL